MAFVSQDVPDLCTDRRVVAPIAPLAARAFASSGGFERFEGFAADEGTSPDGGEEQQHIRRQVGQFAVARLIQPPAPADLSLVDGAFGIVLGQLLAGGFEFVNLATCARLMPIDASRIKKQWTRELQRVLRLGRV